MSMSQKIFNKMFDTEVLHVSAITAIKFFIP